MSPVIGLVLLLASGYVRSLAVPEYNPHYRLREHGTYKEISKSGKPGTCPADVDYPTCDPLVIYKPECRKDRDCDGVKKCCFSGCTNRCLLPLQDKLNPCPIFDHSICIRVRSLPSTCHNDSQCQGSQRCCCNNCRRECTPTVRVKPGQCPAPKKNIIAKPCTKDSDCHGTKKCCGQKCVTPEEEHPGVCPISLENMSCIYLQATWCKRDCDCPPNKKCCLTDVNNMQCQAVKNVKPGFCPVPNTSCRRLDDDKPKCTCDKECPGPKKCCTRRCRQECTDPVTDIP